MSRRAVMSLGRPVRRFDLSQHPSLRPGQLLLGGHALGVGARAISRRLRLNRGTDRLRPAIIVFSARYALGAEDRADLPH